MKIINNISEISLNYKNVIENDKIQANQFLDLLELFIKIVKERGLSEATCNNLDSHGYSVLDHIKNLEIRNLHPMQD